MTIRVLDFFDGFTSASAPSSVSVIPYDAVVSTGGESFATHSTLAAALATAQSGYRILVLTGETLNTTVTISLNNLTIECAADVTYTKGSATTAFNTTGFGNRIIAPRFVGFSGGSDVAINVSGNYNRIESPRFNNCRLGFEVVDSGLSTVVSNMVVE